MKPIRFTTSKNGFEWRAYTFRIYSKSFRLNTENNAYIYFRMRSASTDAARIRVGPLCDSKIIASPTDIAATREKNERNFSFPDSCILFSSFEQLRCVNVSVFMSTNTDMHTQEGKNNQTTPPPACIEATKLCTAYIHRRLKHCFMCIYGSIDLLESTAKIARHSVWQAVENTEFIHRNHTRRKHWRFYRFLFLSFMLWLLFFLSFLTNAHDILELLMTL